MQIFSRARVFSYTDCSTRKKEKVDGVQIEPIRSRTNFLDRIYHLPLEAVKKAEKQDADIYHFHDPELLPYMKKLSKKGKNVIWDAHENYRDTIKSFNSLKIRPLSWIGSEWFNWLELKYCKKHFSGVVTITEKMTSKYLKKNINVCVLSNYAKVKDFKYKGDQKIISKKPRLISSGAHFRPRAISEIVESFSYLEKEDVEYYFSGKFVDIELKDEVISRASELDPQGDNIVIEGELEYLDLINRAIPSAWVGTVLFDISDPNNRNGLPNRFFECWANGVPVITTDGTEVAKVVKKHGGGIVINDNDPKNIAEAFKRITSSEEYRNDLSQQAYNAIYNGMNWEDNFKNLLKLYNRILK